MNPTAHKERVKMFTAGWLNSLLVNERKCHNDLPKIKANGSYTLTICWMMDIIAPKVFEFTEAFHLKCVEKLNEIQRQSYMDKQDSAIPKIVS